MEFRETAQKHMSCVHVSQHPANITFFLSGGRVRVAPAAMRGVKYIYCSVPSGKSNFNLAMEDTDTPFRIAKYESRHIHGGFSSCPLWL